MAIIIQNERIVDLSKMNVIRACIKYGRCGEYELRAFEDRDSIGYYICDVPDCSEIPKMLSFLAKIKHDRLILTPQEVIQMEKVIGGKDGNKV